MEKLPLRVEFENRPKWKLYHYKNEEIKLLEDILWVNWSEDGTIDEYYYHIDEGRCPFITIYGESTKYILKPVTYIGHEKERNILFHTDEGEYELIKIWK